MEFKELGLSDELVKQLVIHKILNPTKIQEHVIKELLDGHDIIAESETGSGKTLGFALPLIDKLQHKSILQCIVLAPTRELAKQIAVEFDKFGRWKGLKTITVYGGTSIDNQIKNLRDTDIVIGTPGRVLDLIWRGNLNLNNIKFAVLDEADRMLDMGFIDDMKKILSKIPRERQTMLFSATINNNVEFLARNYLRNPKKFRVEMIHRKLNITHSAYFVEFGKKFSLLVHLLKEKERKLTIVFCKTKHSTKTIAEGLEKEGIEARSLSGNMTQNQREKTLDMFKAGKIDVLVATDVAARGLHVEDISHVYNFDLPDDVDSYQHRVGRTGRVGKPGDAISFVTDKDRHFYYGLKNFFKNKIIEIEPRNFPILKTPFRGHKTRFRSNPNWHSRRQSNFNRRDDRPKQRSGFKPRKNYNLDID